MSSTSSTNERGTSISSSISISGSGRSSISSSNSIACNFSSGYGDVAEQIGRRVLDELIATERNYLHDLSSGFERYTHIFTNESDLPAGLKNQQDVLLSYISQIIHLHRHKLLPLMLQYRNQLELLFERWLLLLGRDYCYCYVLFGVSQRATVHLYRSHGKYFKRLQITLCDPLGISSFLLKPVQRLAGYPLLLNSLIKLFFKNSQLISKRLFELACRLETRLRELLDRVNQADQLNDIHNFDAFSMLKVARFITVGEFGLIDGRLRRSYKCKLFTFNTCFVYTEKKKGKHLLRGKFMLPDVCFVAKSKSFLLCNKICECEFHCDPAMVQKWDRIIRQVILSYVRADGNEASTREGVRRRSIWYI